VVPPPRQRRRRRRSGSRHGAKAGGSGARAQGCLRQESARLVRARTAAWGGEGEGEEVGRAWGRPRRVRVDAPRGGARGFYLAGGVLGDKMRRRRRGGAGGAPRGRSSASRCPSLPRRRRRHRPRPGQRPKPPTHPHHPLSRDLLAPCQYSVLTP
jgi:hypothetical protein